MNKNLRSCSTLLKRASPPKRLLFARVCWLFGFFIMPMALAPHTQSKRFNYHRTHLLWYWLPSKIWTRQHAKMEAIGISHCVAKTTSSTTAATAAICASHTRTCDTINSIKDQSASVNSTPHKHIFKRKFDAILRVVKGS